MSAGDEATDSAIAEALLHAGADSDDEDEEERWNVVTAQKKPRKASVEKEEE